jgi:hypothetical protein
MKPYKLLLTIISATLFLSFITPPKKYKNYCGGTLIASNQSTGNAKLTRITYYNNNGENVSKALNLGYGQSTTVGLLQLVDNEISVQTKGIFNYIVFEDAYNIPIYSQAYNGSNTYWFYNLNFQCEFYYLKLY